MSTCQTPRIPSLDGLRAVSIALVLLGHLCGTRGFPASSQTAMLYSNFGVRVFFVISGFLITTMLIQERENRGQISLSAFYVRRAWRIFPAAFAYLLVIVPLNWTALSRADILSAITYTVNYRNATPWSLGHLWSLAVEEQFYLLWPLVLALAWRRRTQVAVFVVAAGPFVRALFYFAGLPAKANGSYFPAVADTLAAGCLIAILAPELRRWRAIASPWFLLVPLASALVPLTHVWLKFYWSVGLTAMNLGIALSVLHCIEKKHWILNVRPVVWIGMLSYSLYLWQQPFLNRASSAWSTSFPVNLCLALLAAMLSYYCVERPGLKLRQKFALRRSQNNHGKAGQIAEYGAAD
jgi:peptidoglycan/LPS O-acetylase OafA/YrhL